MKRTRFDIMRDILKASIGGANKTKIVYGAKLNFRIAKQYIDFLIEAEMLQQKSHGKNSTYHTTEKGKEILSKFEFFESIFPSESDSLAVSYMI